MHVMRRWLLGLVAFGLAGITVELLLFQHYEDIWQWTPLVIIAMTYLAIGWHLFDPRVLPVRAFQAMMILLVLGGMLGLALHYQGNVEFQLEIDPTLRGWPLFVKAIHAKTPPALAPASMAQLGLLGLVYTYRHPALKKMTPGVISVPGEDPSDGNYSRSRIRGD